MFLYGQRRENVLHEIPCRTSRFLNSFYTDTIRSWNNIGYEFRNCSSLSKFKSKSLNLIRPPKKSIFGIHEPCGIKLLFQLRVGLSPLKGHKKNHNFLTLHRQYVTVEAVRTIPSISLLNVLYLQLSGLI